MIMMNPKRFAVGVKNEGEIVGQAFMLAVKNSAILLPQYGTDESVPYGVLL